MKRILEEQKTWKWFSSEIYALQHLSPISKHHTNKPQSAYLYIITRLLHYSYYKTNIFLFFYVTFHLNLLKINTKHNQNNTLNFNTDSNILDINCWLKLILYKIKKITDEVNNLIKIKCSNFISFLEFEF